MSDPTSKTTIPPIVCRICGYSPDELRRMVQPGECDIATQLGQKPDRCFANSADFVQEKIDD